MFPNRVSSSGDIAVYLSLASLVLSQILRQNPLKSYCLFKFMFQLRLERQATILNGSRIENARFGSAISSIGDINKDGFNGMCQELNMLISLSGKAQHFDKQASLKEVLII